MSKQGLSLHSTERAAVPLCSVHFPGDGHWNSPRSHVLELVLEMDLCLLVVCQMGYVCAAEPTTIDWTPEFFLARKGKCTKLLSFQSLFLFNLTFAVAFLRLT